MIEAEDDVNDRGNTVVPDILANAGGVGRVADAGRVPLYGTPSDT